MARIIKLLMSLLPLLTQSRADDGASRFPRYCKAALFTLFGLLAIIALFFPEMLAMPDLSAIGDILNLDW